MSDINTTARSRHTVKLNLVHVSVILMQFSSLMISLNSDKSMQTSQR
jgi:hypothetical protein